MTRNNKAQLLAILLLVSQSAVAIDKDITLGTSADWPPFNEVVDNELVGFDIEIADLICKKLNINCHYKIVSSWDSLIPYLVTGKVDALITSMSPTKEREEIITFSDKYYSSVIRMIKSKSSDIHASSSSMKNRKVGVARDSIFDHFVTDLYQDYFSINRYDKDQKVYDELVASRIEIGYVDALQAELHFLNSTEGQNFEFFGPEYTAEAYLGKAGGIAVGVRKNDFELANAFSRAIKEIREDGSYQIVSSKYFGKDIY